MMYMVGEGVVQSDTEAVRWFRAAANQGNDSAQFSLGGMYQAGRGVPQSDIEAARWYRLAAEQGNREALYNLGTVHVEGASFDDIIFAYMWFNLAARQGNDLARQNRDDLAVIMRPEDIRQAQRLSERCLARNYSGC
jgi:TPR repeat protein